MEEDTKWGDSQKYEEGYTIRTLGLSVSNRDRFLQNRNLRKSPWSFRLNMFKPIETNNKVIIEIGCCVSGPIHDFSNGLKIGLEPLIDKLKPWCDPSVSYIKAIGEAIPLRDGCVDIALTWNSLDHCISPMSVLNEIHRVTKNDGNLFLLLNTFSSFFPELLLKLIDSTHLHHYTPAKVLDLVNKFFKIVDKTTMKGVTPSGSKSLKEKIGNKFVTRFFLHSKTCKV